MIYIPNVFIVLYSICFVMWLVLFLVWEDSKGITRFSRIRKRFAKGVK